MLLFDVFSAFYATCPMNTGMSSYLIDSELGFPLSAGLAGGSPAATHFLLLRQKKVSKEKATLVSASLRCASGSLRCALQAGSAQTRLRLKQCAALIRLKLCSSAQTQGVGEEQPNSRAPKYRSPWVLAWGFVFGFRSR